jgi:hypothetical protein
MVVYDSAPHGLYLTHREQVNHDLLAFIEDSEALTVTPRVQHSAAERLRDRESLPSC